MANNRLYIGHEGVKSKVYLGKRMAWGWYGVPDDVRANLAKLLEMTEGSDGSQDSFVIMLEDIGENEIAKESRHDNPEGWELIKQESK